MESFLTYLRLSDKKRIALQLFGSVLIIYAIYCGYQAVQPMLDNMETMSMYPNDRLSDVPTWLFFTVLILGIIPGVYVFLVLRDEFKKIDSNCF